MINERLHRYLELKDATQVAFHLVKMRRGGKLLKQFEAYFIKHRKAISLDIEMKNLVHTTFSICGGSPTIFAALEDPNIEVPGIDPNIPKMNRVPGGDSRRTVLPRGSENKMIEH